MTDEKHRKTAADKYEAQIEKAEASMKKALLGLYGASMVEEGSNEDFKAQMARHLKGANHVHDDRPLAA